MIKIDKDFTDKLITKANKSERKRTNYNFHKEYSDVIQRMLNVMDVGTYIQPHKHENPDKREVFLVLKGKGLVVEFDDNGQIIDSIILDRNNDSYGCEFDPRIWHTIICLENGSVFYELKDGPYEPLDDKNFAAWAPKEGEPDCAEYLTDIQRQLGINIK